MVEVPLPACCPDCGGQVTLDEVAPQFRRSWYPRTAACAATTSRWPLPRLSASGAVSSSGADVRRVGRAGVMLGPRAHALASWLHVGLGVPMAKM
ncbi:MAG: hypothetical protein ACRDYA_04825 [Egibacteraceae bacterium]